MGASIEAGLLYGVADVTLDKAGRFLVPAQFTDNLLGGSALQVTLELAGRYLELWPVDEFKAMVDRLREEPMDPRTGSYVFSHYVGFSIRVEIDRANRLTVPKRFRSYLQSDELTLVGVGKLIQVWDRETYTRHMEDAREILENAARELRGPIYDFGRPKRAATGETKDGE